MILCIADVLTADELASIVAVLSAAAFGDGRDTAGWNARLVKRNLQALKNDPARGAAEAVETALRRNALFASAALPRRIAPVMFSRYEQGMAYGSHFDDAVMGGANPLRSDIAMTLFLSAPADCDGGELVIETTGGEEAYKLDPGSAVIYPATTLHRVEPVRRGVRVAAVTWVESLVRDAAKREILFDLDNARRALFAIGGKTREFDLVSKSHANLLRRWAET